MDVGFGDGAEGPSSVIGPILGILGDNLQNLVWVVVKLVLADVL